MVVRQGYGDKKLNGKFGDEGEMVKSCHKSKDGGVRKAEIKK